MEGPPFRVPFSDGAHPWLSECGCRWIHVDYENLSEKIKYCFKEDSTQRIFRTEEEDVKYANPADSDEKGNEIVASRVQDDDSEVSFQEKQSIFE